MRTLALVDGEHDVATGEQVDLAADEPWWLGIIGLHRLQRDVEELGGAGEAGASVVGHEAPDIGICQLERIERRPQLVLLAAGIDVDPQEALRA